MRHIQGLNSSHLAEQSLLPAADKGGVDNGAMAGHEDCFGSGNLQVTAEHNVPVRVRRGGDQVVTGVPAPRMGDRHRPTAEIDHGVTDLVLRYPQPGDPLVDLVGVRAVAHGVHP